MNTVALSDQIYWFPLTFDSMASTLSAKDLTYVWHPYTQHLNLTPPIVISRGSGALLFDENGQSYIDAISSWWVNIHGHAHPYIAEKIYQQALKLEHVIFTGFTHEPAVILAERLINLLPGDFTRIFYSDNGSTAVEVALKMAIQFRQNKSAISESGKRKKIIALRNAYHGDTFGAMSISERGIFTLAFQDYLFEVKFIDAPDPTSLKEIKSQLEPIAGEICCFIYEPLLQAAGGMKIYDANALDQLLKFFKSKNIVCIADEVLTGFGRTGKLFASEYIDTEPDIICLSKGLTGGTMALGVTAAKEEIFDAFLSSDKSKTFFHGHSYTANPLACTAALASLDLFGKPACKQKISWISKSHEDFICRLKETSPANIKCARAIGTVLAFEISNGSDSYLNNIGQEISARALKNGIFLRPLGNTVYTMPPYCLDEEQLAHVHQFLLSLSEAPI
jgi:adenosylmethionine-8-amino-7-oxononanoate aminotransferase